MTGTILRMLPVATVLVASACATAGMGADGARDEGERAEQYVVVNNTSWETVRVYALRHNVKMRLGLVPGKTSATFDLQSGMLSASGKLRLMLVPSTGGMYVMDMIPLGQNRALQLDLDRRLDRSTYTVLAEARP